MIINFNFLQFKIDEDKILMSNLFTNDKKYYPFVQVQIAGENRDSHLGAKQIISSQGDKLCYVRYSLQNNKLEIIQRSDKIEVTSVFESFLDTKTIKSYNIVKNISNETIVLESISSFVGYFGDFDYKDIYFYRFHNSHHTECQVKRLSFDDYGLVKSSMASQKSISHANVGTWSSKEEIPQGIIEYKDNFLMFQIQSNNSWYYEISDNKQLYVFLGGANKFYGDWTKPLKQNENYLTTTVAVALSQSLNGVIGEMTKYRRYIVREHKQDKNLPTIFNEYMHLSWDSPNEQQSKNIALQVSKMGIEYYVIDCGWHDEEDGNIIYPYVGKWKESKKRYPSGIRKMSDYIHSLGMKFGLWIEPEIIGYKCSEMLSYYDDDCFFCMDGKRITVMGRQFLDFRHPKVVKYMTDTIDRMVNEYKVDYIKFDYNQDAGIGTEINSFSLGDGLEKAHNAYFEWVKKIMDTYPDVIIEACSSGGLRMDYKTLSIHSIISTSDQTNYIKYPYIVGNILSAVLPEQSAVWSYPVDSLGNVNEKINFTYKEVNDRVDRETVIMNMINSLLGRMHLASHIELLSEDKKQLIKEGIDYYHKLTKYKKNGLPYFPLGFTNFYADRVASGFICEKTLYLGVWNLKDSKTIVIPIDKKIRNVKVGYPYKDKIKYYWDEQTITIDFPKGNMARFFEIDLL